MNVEKVESELRKFLAEDYNNIEELSNDDSLLEKGIIDSVKMLELIEFIENKYKLKVDEDDLIPENFDSINAIKYFILRKQNNESSLKTQVFRIIKN